MSIRIHLADDHVVVRQGVRVLLKQAGMVVVGEAADGPEILRLAHTHQPDVAVLDIAMPHLNGLETARRLRETVPQTKIIVLTMHPEEPYVLEALQAGAVGYVLKTQAAADIVQAIHTVLQGAIYLSPRVTNAVMQAYLACATLPPDPLTSRECKIVQRIAEGQTTKEIAAHLGLSVKTVESHCINLMRKLDIHETATLVRYAIRRGAAPPEGDTAVSGGCRRSPFPPFPAQAFPRAPSGIYRMAVPARIRYLPMSMTAWKCTKIGNLAMSCFSGIQFARMLVYEHYNPLKLCEIRRRRTRRRVL